MKYDTIVEWLKDMAYDLETDEECPNCNSVYHEIIAALRERDDRIAELEARLVGIGLIAEMLEDGVLSPSGAAVCLVDKFKPSPALKCGECEGRGDFLDGAMCGTCKGTGKGADNG